MRAIQIKRHGGPEQLVLTDLPVPEPDAAQVLVKVHAFGVNRAETYMRSGAWGDVARVTGIECVGEVCRDPSGRLRARQPVIALMGGMGRTIQGSYAEYVAVPSTNVVPIETTLTWTDLAAIPESYATAWSCVDANLALQPEQTLLVRGGTSSLGQAAINIARERGAHVFATTRSESNCALLAGLGARALVDHPELAARIRDELPAGLDGVLDLVGTATMLDSLAATRRGGRVCVAGFLGGHRSLAAFDPVMQLPSGVHLSVFASFMLGTAGFPVDRIPFQEIVRSVERSAYRALPTHVFTLEQVARAHALLEANAAKGKIVVTVTEQARSAVSMCS